MQDELWRVWGLVLHPCMCPDTYLKYLQSAYVAHCPLLIRKSFRALSLYSFLPFTGNSNASNALHDASYEQWL